MKSIWLSVLLFFSSRVFCCQKVYAFSYSNCAFNVVQTDSSCKNLALTSCTFQICTSYNSNRYPPCLQKAQRSYTIWQQCTQQCCDPNTIYPLTYDSLKLCQKYLNDRQIPLTTVLAIIIPIASAIVISLIVLCCCWICYCSNGYTQAACKQCIDKWCCGCCCFQRENQFNYFQRPPEIARNLSEAQIRKIESMNDRKWLLSASLVSFDGPCPVCLQINCTVMLNCSHFVHLKCLKEWVKRKIQCPVCRDIDLSSLLIYCSQCKIQYFIASLIQIGAIKNNIKCPSC